MDPQDHEALLVALPAAPCRGSTDQAFLGFEGGEYGVPSAHNFEFSLTILGFSLASVAACFVRHSALMQILYLTPERHPTDRSDVATLFGKYMPHHGIRVDLVARALPAHPAPQTAPWPAGAVRVVGASGSPWLQVARLTWLQAKALCLDTPRPALVIVRDMPSLGAFAALACQLRRVPFCYWMSFPITDGYRLLAARGWRRVGLARWAVAHARAWLGELLLGRITLAWAAHVFVQSEALRQAWVARGLPAQRMTAVPMGVDVEATTTHTLTANETRALAGRDVVLYVGTFGAARQLSLVLEAFALAWQQRPALKLVMVGQEALPGEEAALLALAQSLGISDQILWTGWRPPHEAQAFTRAACMGLSLIPRGPLFDVSSPTKLVEYLAAGLPAIANDLPDQALVAARSQAVQLVPMVAADIAQAIVALAGDAARRQRMAQNGQAYVSQERSYAVLSEQVANRLKAVAMARGSHA
jgi:glycosyltransferase involved in cell wall biosynthesis